ncbi:MAG: hypothetical protein HY737_06840 [Candidatus Omnitrophica bacterium]|nr:hypothetical protein [Candidatus Omnitrophota bacterium]
MRLTKAPALILSAMLSIMVFLGYQSRAAANKLFGNMTYRTTCPYLADKITLVNGHGVLWYGIAHVSMDYGGRYVYGDFNHDGLTDAAVVITESQGGSDDERFLAFLINDGKYLVHRQSVYLGDSAIINSVKARGDQVVVDMLIHQEGDCQAGPTKHVVKIYEYEKDLGA